LTFNLLSLAFHKRLEMPTETGALSRAKSILGWGDDNTDQYKKWRNAVKAQCVSQGIGKRNDADKAKWTELTTFAMNTQIGLPASGLALLQREGPGQGMKAREALNFLLLNCL
jgi:hypothetical protein